MPLPPPIDPSELDELLGATLAAFSERVADLGAVVRVAIIDGEPQAVTLDYSPRRINVAVEGDEPVVVSIEGIG